MHSNRVLILNNEIRQEGQQWGTDHGVELDFTNTKYVHVITGANSLAYGSDAIGGVIILNPAQLRRKHGIEGSVFVGGESNGRKGITGAEINGNFKAIPQLSYRLQGSLKKGGNVHSPDYFIDNTGLEEKNYSWAVGYKANNYGIQIDYSDYNADFGVFSGAHIGNLTDLNNAFNANQPNTANEFSYEMKRPFQYVSHEMVKVKSFFYLNDAGKLELIYGRQFNQRSEYDTHSEDDVPDFNFNLTSHTADLKYTHHGKWKHQYGIQGGYQTNTWSGRFFIPNFEKYTVGGYVIESITKGKHTFDFGARYDFNHLNIYYYQNSELLTPTHQFQNLNGNIGYTFKVKDSLTFHTNIGSAWRPPSVNELYSNGLHHGSAALEYGNQNLGLEQVFNWNASVEKNWKKWYFRSQVYANYFSNYTYLSPTGETQLTIRGAFPVYEFKQVEAMLNGLDLEVKYALHPKVDLDFGSSFIRANNLTNNNYLWGMPADEYNSSIQLKPNLGKRFKKTVLELNFQYVSQQHRYQIEDDFATPPEGYALLNIKAYTQLNFKTPLTLFFNVNNVLDTSYRSYLNRFRYFTDEMGRNFTFGIKYNFEVNENHHHHK
jgi:iron complex outermembrane receptor protein